jgi:hypothetical protein
VNWFDGVASTVAAATGVPEGAGSVLAALPPHAAMMAAPKIAKDARAGWRDVRAMYGMHI